MNQKLAMKVLERHGDAVEIAENGSLAVDVFKAGIARGRPFDIILVGGHLLFCYSETVALIVDFRCVDGCVDAFHVQHGNHGTHLHVRAMQQPRANAQYRSNGNWDYEG